MNRLKVLLTIVMAFSFGINFSQEDEKEAIRKAEKSLQESKNYTYQANEQLNQNDFVNAEGEYRKAISKSKENVAAPYNLGRAYYNRESYTEAFGRFKNAGEKATEKPDKHKAFHNLGNVFMKNKEYGKAVEAYKEALRANPNDDETRYNLALAKKKQEEDQKNNKDDQNQDQQNEDNKNDQNQNQDDNKDQGENEKKDEGDQKDQQGDEGDKGNEKPEENKEGEGDKKKEEEQKPKQQGDEKEKEKNPRPNQLSKQQIQNLLEAMQNEEKKVQEKLNAQKVKGKKIKNEKDW
ncbi:tetratricopeptide repeat protein [Croceivirga thetidis]|uniref:Tetratricopeptide repeat protein n=1 Tax=Croceivirga thetidis TaxID=2721623 RepID=A0ABX1GP35_9FLAO|nr:tetratricopeptide repeat protein [Croceivirga thetidis]NKI31394.1 tetratricopeptide repeat protein [Croceivirga thetidis]